MTLIRNARDSDAEGLIGLIGGCWSEYPGCILDVDGELPELRAIATAFAKAGGRFWIAEAGGAVVGSAGVRPSGVEGVELCKLYVRRDCRRQGLGGRLIRLAEEEGRRRGAGFIELWSDTRFLDAHRQYERHGYVRGPETRALHDLSNSVEYYYSKPLAGPHRSGEGPS